MLVNSEADATMNADLRERWENQSTADRVQLNEAVESCTLDSIATTHSNTAEEDDRIVEPGDSGV